MSVSKVNVDLSTINMPLIGLAVKTGNGVMTPSRSIRLFEQGYEQFVEATSINFISTEAGTSHFEVHTPDGGVFPLAITATPYEVIAHAFINR